MTLPKLDIPRKGKLTDINGRKVKFRIEKYVALQQSNYPNKILVLQEILFETYKFPKRKKELRIGYYIIGKKPKMKGKWVWGQSAPFIPKKDLKRLLEKAKKGII